MKCKFNIAELKPTAWLLTLILLTVIGPATLAAAPRCTMPCCQAQWHAQNQSSPQAVGIRTLPTGTCHGPTATTCRQNPAPILSPVTSPATLRPLPGAAFTGWPFQAIITPRPSAVARRTIVNHLPPVPLRLFLTNGTLLI